MSPADISAYIFSDERYNQFLVRFLVYFSLYMRCVADFTALF